MLNPYEGLEELLVKAEEKDDSLFDSSFVLLDRLASEFKPYEGKMWRNGKYIDIRFYDEREWRYVPNIRNHDIDSKLSKEEFLNGIKRSSANSNLQKEFCLKFKAKDVKYIIAKNEEEMIHLFDAIDSMDEIYEVTEMKLLKTKIICSDQIRDDF